MYGGRREHCNPINSAHTNLSPQYMEKLLIGLLTSYGGNVAEQKLRPALTLS